MNAKDTGSAPSCPLLLTNILLVAGQEAKWKSDLLYGADFKVATCMCIFLHLSHPHNATMPFQYSTSSPTHRGTTLRSTSQMKLCTTPCKIHSISLEHFANVFLWCLVLPFFSLEIVALRPSQEGRTVACQLEHALTCLNSDERCSSR
jgi:hypothetical protein